MLTKIFLKNKDRVLKHKFPHKKKEIGRWKNKSVLVYYIRIKIPPELYKGNGKSLIDLYNKDKENNIVLYKIGITGLSVEERVRSLMLPEGVKAEILLSERFNGICGICLEKWLHAKFINYRIGFRLIESGNSEIYREDVLEIDGTHS